MLLVEIIAELIMNTALTYNYLHMKRLQCAVVGDMCTTDAVHERVHLLRTNNKYAHYTGDSSRCENNSLH